MPDAQQGTLYIVATPIGNLGDITERAKDALAHADVIFCEDTRVTGKLLNALGLAGVDGSLRAELRRLDENALSREGAAVVLECLRAGMHVAYCSDAGMPGVSDPGQRLVLPVREAGFKVEVLPGATAVDAAFVASGTAATAYYFGAFLPRKAGERAELLRGLASLDAALVFYESPKRVVSALDSIGEVLPHREVAVCRELTKLHEEIVRGLAVDVATELAAREGGVKGEIVIVIDPPSEAEREERHGAALQAAQELAALVGTWLSAGAIDKRAMSAELQELCGVSRNEAYDIVMDAGARNGDAKEGA